MKVLERTIIVAAFLGLLSWNALAEEPSSQGVRPFPSAVRTFPKRPPYNALRLGPGNTFPVGKIPPDYDLTATEFSPDGRWIALGWASGRIEQALDGYLRREKEVIIMKPATHLASVLLAAVSLAHLLRIVFGVQVTLADSVIPMWVSWVAFLVAGGVAIMLWREARRQVGGHSN